MTKYPLTLTQYIDGKVDHGNGQEHEITNPFDNPCHIIEIQFGEACVEDDIERVEYYEES